MKIRTTFVTNSSSSSFVLAIRKDITISDYMDIIEQNREGILKFIRREGEYYENSDIKDILNDESRLFNAVALDLITWLKRHCKNIDLGDWTVGCGEITNESEDIITAMLYSCYLKLDCEKIKMGYS